MTATVPTDHAIDVHDMVVVHRVFRRELAALAPLIRAVPDGDVRRTGTVVAHVHLVLTGLQIHHTGEDEVLWPLLHERTDADALVDAMAAQHERIHVGIETAGTQVDAWATTGSADAGERLAATLDALRVHLVEHLDAEERDVLPLAARHLTAAEWDGVGEHGRDSMTRAQLPLMFGAILEDADAAERASMYAALPVLVRVLLKTVGARQYRRYITRVRTAG